MKKMNMLLVAAGAMAVLLCGCGGGDDNGPSRTPVPTTTTTTTANDAAETVYVTVTGADGAVVTDAEGEAVTTAIEATSGDPTTATDDATTTEEAVTTSTATTTKATTTTTTTTTAKPTTTKAKTTTSKAATAAKTTKATTAKPTTTTTKATTTTAADTRPTVMWKEMNMPIYCNYDDPWKYPYDVEACRQECKEYIESKGLIWDESLTLDNSNWAGNISTVAYAAWPDDCNLKRDPNGASVFGKIDFEASSWDSSHYNVIWVPDSDAPFEGCYEIYVVH